MINDKNANDNSTLCCSKSYSNECSISWEDYVPFQPLQYLKSYHHHVVMPGEPLYGIAWEFYEFSRDEYVSKLIINVPDACTDLYVYLDNDLSDVFHRNSSEIITYKCVNKTNLKRSTIVFGIKFIFGEYKGFMKLSTTNNFIQMINRLGCSCNLSSRMQIVYDYLSSNQLLFPHKHELISYIISLALKLNGNVRVSHIVAQSGYCPRYLGNIFKEYSGLPLKKFLDTIRLQSSIQTAIIKPHITGNEIATICGYSNYDHMIKCYQKNLGLSYKDFIKYLSVI